jgi:hypothetical protein
LRNVRGAILDFLVKLVENDLGEKHA